MNRLFPLPFVVGLLLPGPGDGAEMFVDLTPSNNGAEWILATNYRNNDVGAVYYSATTEVYAALGGAVYALGNSAEASAEEMMNGEWGMNVIPFEVDNGWSVDAVGTTVHLTNNGLTVGPGIPLYDTWQNTSSNPNQDMLAMRVAIPNGLVELNGISGYQVFTLSEVEAAGWDPGMWDAIVVLSDSPLLEARNRRQARPAKLLEEAFVGSEGIFTYATPGLYYVLLDPRDYAEWTDFGGEHAGLDPEADANGNGRSNFLDYASGQDPEAAGLLPIVELDGTTLTLRQRINGLDAEPVVEYSDDLDDWFPLEEGVDHTVVSETVAGVMRTWELELVPGPEVRFIRQRFGP